MKKTEKNPKNHYIDKKKKKKEQKKEQNRKKEANLRQMKK